MRMLAPRHILLLSLSLFLCSGRPGVAFAFHDGGVASCQGCHIMHESEDGQVVLDGQAPLLRAASATDLCLTCHAGQNGVMGSDPLAPPPERGAGNFVFLLEDNINDGPGGTTDPISGEAAGHSIVSWEFGLEGDSRWLTSPGGLFPTNQLGCTSCHDPHGRAGFRMLNGVGEVQNGLYEFLYPAPEAQGLDVTDALAAESPGQHTAYRQGMGQWCANCHLDYLTGDHTHPSTGFRHPGDAAMRPGMAMHYQTYDGTANPDGGIAEQSYLPEVPFEDLSATTTSTAGPTISSRVMCLSCHRAHASSAPAAGRWDFEIDELGQDGLVSGSYPLPNPYADPNQGRLCAKCHPGAGMRDSAELEAVMSPDRSP